MSAAAVAASQRNRRETAAESGISTQDGGKDGQPTAERALLYATGAAGRTLLVSVALREPKPNEGATYLIEGERQEMTLKLLLPAQIKPQAEPSCPLGTTHVFPTG